MYPRDIGTLERERLFYLLNHDQCERLMVLVVERLDVRIHSRLAPMRWKGV